MSNSKSLMNEPTYRSSFFQKGEVKEQHIKMAMKPQDSFNPARIDDYINPQKSKEEQINDKVKAGKKLTSAEKIQNENFQKKRKEVLASDMHKIERIKYTQLIRYKPGWNQHSVFPEWK